MGIKMHILFVFLVIIQISCGIVAEPLTIPISATEEIGNPLEAHQVITADGYILTVHRLPGRIGSTPVFLQHGILESSDDWLLAGRERSLAYILHNNGYDVWIGNARGNTHSKNHIYLSPKDSQFWDFSWEELGRFDHPAVFQYIYSINPQKMIYIGHSMGATSFSVLAIERPDIAAVFKGMIALAPAVYENHIAAPIKLLAPFWKLFQVLHKRIGVHEILSRTLVFDAWKIICGNIHLLVKELCGTPLFVLAGFNPEQLDPTLLPKIWSSFPAGTSVKLFTHWLQQMRVNQLRRFDYGPIINKQVYGMLKPPAYDLSLNRIPTAIFYSDNDKITTSKDVLHFYEELPNKFGLFKVPDPKFNHFDFLWALDAPELVYKNVLITIDQMLRSNF